MNIAFFTFGSKLDLDLDVTTCYAKTTNNIGENLRVFSRVVLRRMNVRMTARYQTANIIVYK